MNCSLRRGKKHVVEVAVGEVAVEEAKEAGGQVEGEEMNTVGVKVKREGQVKVVDNRQGAEDKQGEEDDLKEEQSEQRLISHKQQIQAWHKCFYCQATII